MRGGMGFKDFYCLNRAFLAKQAWRVINNPQSLWVKVIKSIYFPNTEFLNAKDKKGSSWSWKGLINGKDLLVKEGPWKIENGKRIRVWEDNWIEGIGKLQNRYNSSLVYVSELRDDTRRQWNTPIIREAFDADISKRILAIPLGSLNNLDTLIWPKDKTCLYSVKSGYYAALEQKKNIQLNIPSSSIVIDNLVWKRYGIP